MNAVTDSRIDSFRQCVERVAALQAELNTLNIALARRDELPGLIEGCAGVEARWLRDELAASAHPLAFVIRQVTVERELRGVLAGLTVTMLAALDAAQQLVTAAAGGPDALAALPFARRHVEELARYQSVVPATPEARQTHLAAVWQVIDAAVAAVPEIEFELRRRK